MMRTLPVLLPLLAWGTAASAQLSCTNAGMLEASCLGGACEMRAGGDFTPLTVAVDDGEVRACAYSGCWTGRIGHRHRSGGHLLLSAEVSREGTEGPGGEWLSLILDAREHIALLRWGAFANPLRCERSGPKQ